MPSSLLGYQVKLFELVDLWVLLVSVSQLKGSTFLISGVGSGFLSTDFIVFRSQPGLPIWSLLWAMINLFRGV